MQAVARLEVLFVLSTNAHTREPTNVVCVRVCVCVCVHACVSAYIYCFIYVIMATNQNVKIPPDGFYERLHHPATDSRNVSELTHPSCDFLSVVCFIITIMVVVVIIFILISNYYYFHEFYFYHYHHYHYNYFIIIIIVVFVFSSVSSDLIGIRIVYCPGHVNAVRFFISIVYAAYNK